MKKYYKWLLMLCVVCFILLCLPSLAHAQSDPSGVDPAGDPDAPLDGGLGFLLAAGIGYGINKMRTLKKKSLP